MDSHEFTEWMAFYTLEPWGAVRDDLRAGVLASTVANYAGKVRNANDPATPSDFFATLGAQAQKAPDDGGVLLDNPDDQSKLLMAAIFKITD